MASAFALLAALVACPAHADERVEADSRALEARLHAPCCRGQMLEAHESEATRALRAEIHARLGRGESALDVERALVARYGQSIVAVPLDADPRSGISTALAVLLVLSAGAAFALGTRWVRRTQASHVEADEPSGPRHEPDALDLRIEAELRRLQG